MIVNLFFSSLQEVTPSSIRNVPSTSEASTTKTTLQTGAIMLASWNYKSPDEDTQDIFKDSSVKVRVY